MQIIEEKMLFLWMNDNFQAPIPRLGSQDVNTVAGSYDTVSFWMYWKGGGWEAPFGFNSYALAFTGTANCLGFTIGGSPPAIYGNTLVTTLLGKWAHVVGVFYNGQESSSKLYINGVSQALSQCFGSGAPGAITSNAQISGWPWASSYYFEGSLANVQIYNGSLSQSQVTQLFNEGIFGLPLTSNTLLVGWYPLSGDANDYSGWGNNPISYQYITYPPVNGIYTANGLSSITSSYNEWSSIGISR